MSRPRLLVIKDDSVTECRTQLHVATTKPRTDLSGLARFDRVFKALGHLFTYRILQNDSDDNSSPPPPGYPFKIGERCRWDRLEITPTSTRYKGKPIELALSSRLNPTDQDSWTCSAIRCRPGGTHIEGPAAIGKTTLIEKIKDLTYSGCDLWDLEEMARFFPGACRVATGAVEYTAVRRALCMNYPAFRDRSAWLSTAVYGAYGSGLGLLLGDASWGPLRDSEDILVLGPGLTANLDDFASNLCDRASTRPTHVDSDMAKIRDDYFDYSLMTTILFMIYSAWYDLPYVVVKPDAPLLLPLNLDSRFSYDLTCIYGSDALTSWEQREGHTDDSKCFQAMCHDIPARDLTEALHQHGVYFASLTKPTVPLCYLEKCNCKFPFPHEMLEPPAYLRFEYQSEKRLQYKYSRRITDEERRSKIEEDSSDEDYYDTVDSV